jgi:oligopeptide/dipeptide ABC transporter ATP-binding protein
MTLLSVNNLRLEIRRKHDTIVPVDDVSFEVGRGEIVGVAGESGSGKSLTLKALIGMTPHDSTCSGELLLDLHGTGLAAYRPADVRGHGVSFVFQEPMTALNPTMRVGDLIAQGPRSHEGLSKRAARARTLELMNDVGIPDPHKRAEMWPHQLSGGLRQRVMIAVALSTTPTLLLCDEPTTALDVSVQDQILALLHRIREQRGISIVFVSHDLAVLGELCDRLVVMYAGRVVETGAVNDVFAAPHHPYTDALTRAMPSLDADDGPLTTIPGQPPDPTAFPSGCRFAPRCPLADDACRIAEHRLTIAGTNRTTACIHPQRLVTA